MAVILSGCCTPVTEPETETRVRLCGTSHSEFRDAACRRVYASKSLYASEANLKHLNLIVLGLVAALLGVAALSAQTSGTTLTSNPVFQKNCAKCHGKTAEGRHFGGPSLVAGDAQKMPSGDLRAIIADGKHRMPKYAGKLTAEEIDTLVSQIKAAR